MLHELGCFQFEYIHINLWFKKLFQSLPLQTIMTLLYYIYSHDLIGSFLTNLRELTLGPHAKTKYEVGCYWHYHLPTSSHWALAFQLIYWHQFDCSLHLCLFLSLFLSLTLLHYLSISLSFVLSLVLFPFCFIAF